MNSGSGRICADNFWGYSSVHFKMSHATGFRSAAVTSQPSLIASRGIAPPPENGSRTFGGRPPFALQDLLTKPVERVHILDFPLPTENTAFRSRLDTSVFVRLRFQRTANLFAQCLACLRRTRIRKQCCEQSCARRRQRSSCGPNMQCRNMPVAHVLLVHRINGCLSQRGKHVQSIAGSRSWVKVPIQAKARCSPATRMSAALSSNPTAFSTSPPKGSCTATNLGEADAQSKTT